MLDFFQEIAAIRQRSETAAFCTIVHSSGSVPRHIGSKMIVMEDGRLLGSVGGGETENRVIQEARDVMRTGKPHKVVYHLVDPASGDPGICGGTVEVFVEPILPDPAVLIVGAGHVGKAVAHLSKWLGYRVVVSDDRAEFCTKENIPEADEFVICNMADLPHEMTIHVNMFVILTTRGVPVDTAGLPALLETRAPFIGIIGSKRRWITTRKNLLGAGISEEKLNRVVSPIGLELQAETPEEIAVSILAEIQMIRTGASGLRMTMQSTK